MTTKFVRRRDRIFDCNCFAYYNYYSWQNIADSVKSDANV